jgi:hypothetical protein
MSEYSFPIRVVMQRRRVVSRWADEEWTAHGVVAAPEGEPSGVELMLSNDVITQYLVRGHVLRLFHDEAENYFLNVAAPEPKVFVIWRKEEGQDIARPVIVTVSYGEAARGMDADEHVDAVAMPPDILAWVGEFVERNYRPEPKRKGGPRDKPSFQQRR